MILLKVNSAQVANAQSNASYLREWGKLYMGEAAYQQAVSVPIPKK